MIRQSPRPSVLRPRRAGAATTTRRAATPAALPFSVFRRTKCSKSLRKTTCQTKKPTRCYHSNQQYSIIALTDNTGSITERYTYIAYGEPVFASATCTVLADSAEDDRYTYTGRERDEGLELYHFRARMYDSGIGRFCGRDPIGYDSSLGHYEFVAAAPSWKIDPSGLYSYSVQDLDQCEANIRSDIWYAELGELNCAVTLLKMFLDRTGPTGASCPQECRESLLHSKLPPGYCLGDYLSMSSKCPGRSSINFKLRGSHNFADTPNIWNQIPTWQHDLHYAFGNVKWEASGSCNVSCNKPAACDSCCDCTANCSISRTVTDIDDFCKKDGSVPNPGKDKFERGNCACALQNSGRGKKFDISCTNWATPRFQNFRQCGNYGPLNETCGKSIQGRGDDWPRPKVSL